ncbi:60S ribosomal protein L28-1 [Linum perenne]
MEKRPKKSAAGGYLVSDLPDEILHSILSRIPCFKKAARTSALSRQWRNLWRSYPVVELDSTRMNLQEFHDATMAKFSRDKQLRMETLKISLTVYTHIVPSSADEQLLYYVDFDTLRSPIAEKLLDLASKRKAKYVEVMTYLSFLCLSFGLLSIPSAEILRLGRIRFASNKNSDDLIVSLNSLRSLHLNNVEFHNEQLFNNLIASSPLLETLEIRSVKGMKKKLRVSNVANLKVLVISACYGVTEIEITASALHNLHIQEMDQEFRIELVTPQLNVLKIMKSKLNSCGDLPVPLNSLRILSLKDSELGDDQVLLNLIVGSPLLETLKLRRVRFLRKLQLSNVPNLKTLKITCCNCLEEIEIAAYELRSLHLRGDVLMNYGKTKLLKIELAVPQLNVFKIIDILVKSGDLEAVVSKLQHLKSLTLIGLLPAEKKLKLSGLKLEEFTLSPSPGLEEIELDAGPCLEKFLLCGDELSISDQIKKCEIKNFAATCHWEVDFKMRLTHPWFESFKRFIARFSKFQTINIDCLHPKKFISKKAEHDYTTPPIAIQHLKIQPRYSLKSRTEVLFEAKEEEAEGSVAMATVPEQLIWEVVKRNNSFLVKQFGRGTSGVVFSKESNNLYNLNSYKHSGLANKKTVTIQPAEKEQAVVLATTKTKKQNKPSALLQKSIMKKEFYRMAKTVLNQVGDNFYRPDLKKAALARLSAVNRGLKVAKSGMKKRNRQATKISGRK